MSFEVGPVAQTGWGRLTRQPTGVTVDVVRLDTYCESRSIDRIDTLKVDVEGADAWVLEGAQRLLHAGRIGTVFFEEDAALMRRLEIVPGTSARLLATAGYHVQPLGPGEFMATSGRAGPEGT